MPAITQLEQVVEPFPGTVLFVTHDRRMLAEVRAMRRWHMDSGRLTARGVVEDKVESFAATLALGVDHVRDVELPRLKVLVAALSTSKEEAESEVMGACAGYFASA